MKNISELIIKDNPKRMLFVFALFFVLIALALALYVVFSITKINNAYLQNSEIQKTLSIINKANLLKKELLNSSLTENFSSTADKSKIKFDSSILEVQSILNKQLSKAIINKNQKEILNQTLNDIVVYQNLFHRIITLYSEKYDTNSGYVLQMNSAIQVLEQCELSVNMVPLVNLKQIQKSFETTHDLIFFQNFKEEATSFLSDIESLELLPTENSLQKEALLENLKNYITSFQKIVTIEKEIGLTDTDGIKGQLMLSFNSIETKLNQINQISEAKSASIAQNIKLSIIFLFGIIIFALIAILSYYIKKVYNPIIMIKQSAEQIANGDLNINLNEIKQNKLLKSIVDSFGKMINKLELTLTQIEDIAKLNLNNKIEISSENDMIGKSVINVQKQLFKFTEEEKKTKLENEKRNWTTEGLAMFSSFLRSNGDLKTIAQTILSNLVKYLKANQGGLYIVNTEDTTNKHIDLLACFAYDRVKYKKQSLEIGEGLIGQCYLEKEKIYMNDIPDDYLRITSGMGGANPRALLIIPAKINESVEAIIEIASFKEFEPYQIEFVEKLAENIASTIWNIQVNEKTKRLLEESQQQTEEMKSKEEEMRQNIEELATIQEEMSRKEKFYQSKINEFLLKEKQYHTKIVETNPFQELMNQREKFDLSIIDNSEENSDLTKPVSEYQLS